MGEDAFVQFVKIGKPAGHSNTMANPFDRAENIYILQSHCAVVTSDYRLLISWIVCLRRVVNIFDAALAQAKIERSTQQI